MKMLQRAEAKKAVIRYGGLLLGTAILSFGLYNIHSQADITEGGALGLQLLIQHWFGISPSVIGPVVDFMCYLLGWKILGGAFLKNAIVSSISYAFFYSLHEKMGYMLPDLSPHPIFAAVLGGLFVGVGVGLVVRSGGASGGDDALALILNRVTKAKLERCYFITDFVVLMLSLSYIPLGKIACSLLTVSISSYVIGKIYKKEDGGQDQEDSPGIFNSLEAESSEALQKD
ncbi:hypothetical protein DW757_16055 [Clostridium sp. AM29-11AC]|mgnify:FL=1|uniref:YitT family protein n=1 Tax=Clostridium sp. AM29-11AC TaxID=2293028 RepID=UPI000E4EDDFC|nr:YitT family protein [Clostridium sp. AM29-11AC]RHT55148.1 hypothetical protein DW757_16055 [Clostridium sp. AM29-11AC]